jgi:hypothetical protein
MWHFAQIAFLQLKKLDVKKNSSAKRTTAYFNSFLMHLQQHIAA